MARSTPAGGELAILSFVCPVWGQLVEVTVVSQRGSFIGLVGCPLSEPGVRCLAPCEVSVKRWCEYASAVA